MVTRYIPIVDDNFTGKEIPADKVRSVKIEIDGEMRELDMTAGSAHFGSLKTFWDKGIPVGDKGSVVRPIKSAMSVTKPAKATKATAAAKTTKNVTVTTVEDRARTWAKDNGANKLPPRLPNIIIDAFNAKDPDKIPSKYIAPVIETPTPATVAKRATKATKAAFREAQVG